MRLIREYSGWAVGLIGIGLAAGLWLSRDSDQPQFNLSQPVHAVGTSQADDYLMATGYVDNEHEAVYYLDYVTGNLTAAVLSRRNPSFQARYYTNVNEGLLKVIESSGGAISMGSKTPKYMMVTGMADLSVTGSNAGQKPGKSVVYVAEVNTGIVLAYIVPWSSNSVMPDSGQLTPWTYIQMSKQVVRREL